jgi:EAL and modified HD-GYP domain-containing signal transduction protein
MTASKPKSDDFPVVTLQPVADAKHGWVALTVGIGGGGDPLAAVVSLFSDLGLGEVLASFPCIVPIDDPAGFDEATAQRIPPSQAILLCRCHSGRDDSAELSRLRELGYRIVLAGPADDAAVAQDCAALAFECLTGSPLTSTASALLQRLPGPHIAFGVDTYQRFHQCANAGFAWFVGNYPLHPSGKGIALSESPRNTLLLKLLGLIVRDADNREIEALLKQDAQLSYHLIRLVNSAAMTRGSPISSFNQAIALLGRRQLQRWLQLLLYANSSKGTLNPLLPRAAFRARLMEVLCEYRGGHHDEQDRAFMTGMFSLLDVLFGRPLTELLEPLNLDREIVEALVSRGGRLGPLMAIVALSKRGPSPALLSWLSEAGLDNRQLAQALVEATRWTLQIIRDH